MKKHSISLTSLATNVSYFKFRLFMTVTTNQERQNHRKNLRNSSKLLFKMNSLYSNNFEETMRQNIKNILKSWSNDDLNKNIAKYFCQKIKWRFQQKHAIEKSHEYNVIQDENDDRKFTFDKTNRKSIKIHCIVDIRQRESTMHKQSKKFNIISRARCWFCEN